MNADAARLFEAVSLMQMMASLAIVVIGFFVVLTSGRTSGSRTLIATGLGIQGLTTIAYIAISIAQHLHVPLEIETTWILYGVMRMIDIVGFLMMLFGMIGLLRRAGLLEAIQEDLESRDNR